MKIIDNIDIGYKSKKLYENVSLDVPDEGVVFVIGENGSGKSTFYKTLLGTIPPLKGKVDSKLRKKMAVVSDYISLPNELTVKNLFELLNEKEQKHFKRQYSEMNQLLQPNFNKKIGKLSSGQKRLVEISMVLAKGKTILVLDEAANALDFKNRQIFLSAIKSISNKGVLCFMTTHELEDIAQLKGSIYVLLPTSYEVKQFERPEPFNPNSLRKFIIGGGHL